MANSVAMKAYKVSEIVFNNKVNGRVQLKLSNKVSHNVKYSQNGTCEAVNGVFSVTPGVEKEFVHVDTFKELFPFAKALITTLSANAGIPPIMVKNVDIEKQEIYRFEMGNKE